MKQANWAPAVSDAHRKCELRFRIEKVSTAFQKKKFKIRITGTPKVLEGKSKALLNDVSALEPVFSTAIESKAKPKRKPKRNVTPPQMEKLVNRLETTQAALTNTVNILRHCVERLSKVEQMVFPNMSNTKLRGDRPLVISARSTSDDFLRKLNNATASRSTSSSSAKHNDADSSKPHAAFPPGPPNLVRMISKDMKEAKGKPPSLQKLGSADWPDALTRINTEDINFFLGHSIDEMKDDEEESEPPPAKKAKTGE